MWKPYAYSLPWLISSMSRTRITAMYSNVSYSDHTPTFSVTSIMSEKKFEHQEKMAFGALSSQNQHRKFQLRSYCFEEDL